MLFNSWQFLLFFPVVTGAYFASPQRFRWLLLLVASCVFYAAFVPAYLGILAVVIAVDYAAGLLIARSEGRARQGWLFMSLAANLSLLGFFKYFNFFAENAQALAGLIGWNLPLPFLQLVLPIGLSFHVFQSLSYVIEVYRGKQAPERHLGIYALYVMFYPQLVAGPIERPQNLLHQFREAHAFEYARAVSGLRLMLWGLFLKVVIADRLALLVNPIWNDVFHQHGLPLVVALAAFAFQVFCDFAGYSYVAIGAARVMGFTLMRNFNRPFCSRSIGELWTRWHVSLSTWFKDYVYLPLGGSRVSAPRRAFNLITIFVLSGLWHGAAWTFVIWGALNGLYIVVGSATASARGRLARRVGFDRWPRVRTAWQVGVTFTLFAVTGVFFRAPSLDAAWHVLTHLHVGLAGQLAAPVQALAVTGLSVPELLLAALLVAALELVHYLHAHGQLLPVFDRAPAVGRYATYYAGCLALLFLGVYGSPAFVYFQF